MEGWLGLTCSYLIDPSSSLLTPSSTPIRLESSYAIIIFVLGLSVHLSFLVFISFNASNTAFSVTCLCRSEPSNRLKYIHRLFLIRASGKNILPGGEAYRINMAPNDVDQVDLGEVVAAIEVEIKDAQGGPPQLRESELDPDDSSLTLLLPLTQGFIDVIRLCSDTIFNIGRDPDNK